ncbi:MAG: lauroyl acyltransferase [Alphaproteobacteria bacterium]|nr:lauroyl acyltransferase [Alphaproteobacteria bacterium]
MKALRYGAEAALFFFFMALFKLLGLDRASAFGGWIGRAIGPRLRSDQTARNNLAAAFPEKSAAERDAIRMAMWDNLGRVIGEYPHLGKFTINGADPRLTVDFPADIAPGTNGVGRMYLSGHFGNWEMLPIAARQLGHDGAAVVRPPNNPLVARYLEQLRGRVGPKTQIAKHAAARRMFATLKAGRELYMLVDQKNDEGVGVPFFGRNAMTTPAPAALALKLGAKIAFVSNRRLDGARFQVTVHPGPDFLPSGDEKADIQALTALITARIEEMVRENPSQWLWIHRRWPAAR